MQSNKKDQVEMMTFTYMQTCMQERRKLENMCAWFISNSAYIEKCYVCYVAVVLKAIPETTRRKEESSTIKDNLINLS